VIRFACWILGGLADALDAIRDRLPLPPRRDGDWAAQSRARRFWSRVDYTLCVARNGLITALWWLEDTWDSGST
jgi:hypothetical protein